METENTMNNNKVYEETIGLAADSLVEAWCAEDAGEHADESAKWFRSYVSELVNDGYDRDDVVRDARARARESYMELA